MSIICKNCGGPAESGATRCIFCGELLPISSNKNEPSLSGASADAPVQDSGRISSSSGAPVRSSGNANDYDIFANDSWSQAWEGKKKNGCKTGIILTDTADLQDRDYFVAALEKYIAKKSLDDIEYCLLDLTKQKIYPFSEVLCDNIVELLKRVYDVAVPDYLMIVGDYSVIPCAIWDNECADDDDNVMSDLAYITLDTDSPWSGAEYSFDNLTSVGRIPTTSKNEFEEAIRYFENTAAFVPYKSADAFAYSAAVWVETSKNEFAPLAPYLITSPEYTSNQTEAQTQGLSLIKSIDSRYNLLCFNLHGSDSSHVWYGQIGRSYPEAVRKSILPKDTQGYVICTEACYGARPTVNVGKEQSIVGYSLDNKCIAFVGSTRIAYGQSSGALSCADVVIGVFAELVAKGFEAGKAFLRALDALCENEMDEVDIKTLAEFALYGDPSVCLIESNAPKTYCSSGNLCKSAPKKDPSLAIKLIPCNDIGFKSGVISNYSMSDRERMQSMAYCVREKGKGYMASNFSAMSEVEPKIFKLAGAESYRAIYSKVEDGIKTVVRMHTDKSGNVMAIYTSK